MTVPVPICPRCGFALCDCACIGGPPSLAKRDVLLERIAVALESMNKSLDTIATCLDDVAGSLESTAQDLLRIADQGDSDARR